jgi:hypothetical protein
VIETAGVVVPAHNEETLLPACLTALRQAARTAGQQARRGDTGCPVPSASSSSRRCWRSTPRITPSEFTL